MLIRMSFMNPSERRFGQRVVGARLGARLGVFAVLLAFTLMNASPALAKGAPDSFADLAAKLLPSVVNISSTQVIESRDNGPVLPQFPPGSPFRDFFKDFLNKNAPKNKGKLHRRKATSLGSGFIIDDRSNGDAYVVTNNHVVHNADEVYVILHDNTRLKATIVGRDVKTDLAVLKVHTSRKLPAVAFGNSDVSRVGDWVLAIGNPFGLGGTVTAGIISARGRDINAGPYDDFIQTDASINRGNSGGPMFNIAGKVIGINTAIYSPSGGSVGIGFAIPSSTANPVIKQLIKYGRVKRGWLGVHIQTVTASIAETLGLKKATGALVADVTKNSPAAKAGIHSGDVILSFDGRRVGEMRQLPRIVADTNVGRTIDVEVWRDGKLRTLKVKIGKLKESEVVAKSKNGSSGPNEQDTTIDVASLGMALSPVSDKTREQLSVPKNAQGVVIVDVDENGSAYAQGIRPGDMLVEVSQQKVDSPEKAKKLVENAKKAGKKSVLLLVQTPSGFRFVAVSLK